MKTRSMKLKEEEVYYLLFSLFALIVSITGAVSNYKIYGYMSIIVWISIFLLTMRYRNFSLYQVFLATFFVFLLARVFLDCIGLFDMRTLDMLNSAQMDDKTAARTLRAIIIFLIGSSYSWMFLDKTASNYYFECNRSNTQKLIRVIETLYYIYFVIFLMKILYIAKIVISKGYLAVFDGTLSNVNFPVIFKGSGTITGVLYYVLIFYRRDKKSFIKYSTLYLIAGSIRIFTGQRSVTFLTFLFVLYLYSTFYKEVKITNKKILAALLITPLIIEIFAQYRIGKSITIENLRNSSLWFLMLKNMGITLDVIAYMVMYYGEFTNRVPFFIGYVVDLLNGSSSLGQTMKAIEKGNYLGAHLTNKLSSEAYLSGRGTGTSIVAEMYDLGRGNLLLLFILSMVLTALIIKICSKAYKTLPYFILSSFLAIDYIFSPRWSVLKSIIYTAFGVIIAVILVFFEKPKKVLDGKRKN